MAESASDISLAILKRAHVLEVAPAADLERLAQRCTVQRFRRGSEIIRRSAPGEALIVVGRGRIKATVPSPNGDGEFLIGVYWPGQAFGEIPMFDPSAQPAAATAVTEAEVVFVPRADLLSLMERRPAVAIRMVEALCDQLRSAVELNLSLRFLDLPSRFYQRLAYLSRHDSRRDGASLLIHHGLSQQELADSIGASREGLNKLIADWKRAGLIESGRGFVHITDWAALAERMPSAVRQNFSFEDDGGLTEPPRRRPGSRD
ncbi:MAG TPA: Crp/Fnr family transcriptional regulator [Candidatus Binatia bacterium]|jgi:CRP-like cAMP-binding protein